MQVEIDEAMHEKAAAGHQTGKLQRPGERIDELAQALKGLGQQDAEKPSAAKATGNARLCKSFQIVVVRVIDDLSIVERFIGRIGDLQCA